MNLVAVIVAKNNDLHSKVIEGLRANLPNAQGANWLAENEACEIPFQPSQAMNKTARRQLAQALRDGLMIEADVVVVPDKNRRKKLLVADMDSTMIEQECLDELARAAGFYEKVAAVTEAAMRGEIAFEPALRERVALLQDLPVSVIDEVIANRITYTEGAKTLVATMKKHGAMTVLVSGGFTLFTKPIAAALGFDRDIANSLGIDHGRLTGQVISPILGREGKLETLLAFCEHEKISVDKALAIGDGANDLAMIEAAGLGIAYHAKPTLTQAADAEIKSTNLLAALYYQGYSRQEFAAA